MPESAKIQFTPAQSAAITARGGSLLVSAAAGSGKTRVLVERVVGLITDPIHPVEADSLLIMTFTNAAAAKLRADITTRLAEEVRAHPGDMRLRRQQLLLQRAAIGTVDAFCLHFVQQHFAALDVPPDFTTAEEAELARIEQETLSAVLESAYTDADFRAFADLYDRGRTDNTAGNAVIQGFLFGRNEHFDGGVRRGLVKSYFGHWFLLMVLSLPFCGDSDEEKVKVLVLTMFFMVLMSGKKENRAGVF